MQTATSRHLHAYRIRNRRHAEFPLTTRAALSFLKLLKAPVATITSQLEVVVTRKDGTVENYGIVSKRVITNNGVGFIVDAHQNLTELENINFHAMGTGGTAEAAADAALVTEVETRQSGVQSEPASNQYRSVATISATAIRAITEHGILSASSAGVLFDRSLFTAINLANGDSIQFTYTVTYTAGG